MAAMAGLLMTGSCGKRMFAPGSGDPGMSLVKSEYSVDASRQSFEIPFVLSNPVEGGVLTVEAVPEVTWIACPEGPVDISEASKFAVTVFANTSSSARSAQLILTYSWDEGESSVARLVSVSQEAFSGVLRYSFDTAMAGYSTRYAYDIFEIDMTMEGISENAGGVPVGSVFTFRLYADLGNERCLQEGTYKIGEDRDKDTFRRSTARLTLFNEDGSVVRPHLQDGTITVEKAGGEYVVSFSLITDEGLEYQSVYEGALPVENVVGPDSTLSADLDLSGFEWSLQYWYTDLTDGGYPGYCYYLTGTGAPGSDITRISLSFTCYVEPGQAPGGTFVASDSMQAGTFLLGYKDSRKSDFAFIFINSMQDYAFPYAGSVTVGHVENEDGTESVSFDFAMQDSLPEPNDITGSFTVLLD